MKAVVQDEYGSTQMLRVEDIPAPVPGPGQVLVRVRAAGVDMSVWHLMTGLPLMARAALGLRRPKLRVRGSEVAGTVQAIGPGVTRFAVGDEVFGVADGSFAEFAVTKERALARSPRNLTPEQTAALPISGITALQAVRREGRVGPGDRVLVLGAGGGVGTYAVQLAVQAGGIVTGVCSAGKAELVRSLGAAHVIDYRSEPVTGEYDVIIDTAGQRPLSVLKALLPARGTIVIVGGEGGGTALLGGFSRSLTAPLFSRKNGRRVIGLIAVTTAADLEKLVEFAEAGEIVPAVDEVYPLERAAEAVDRMASGGAAGKLVISVR